MNSVSIIPVSMSCPCSKNTIHLRSDSPVLTEDKLLSQVVCVFCWSPLITSRQRNTSLKIPPLVADCGHVMHVSCLQFREEQIQDFPVRCPKCGHIIRKTKFLKFLDYKDDEAKRHVDHGN